MAMKRSLRKRLRQMDALAAHARNGGRKKKERARRDARMIGIIETQSLPYNPAVMSWLSRTLDKRAGKITPDDIQTLLS